MTGSAAARTAVDVGKEVQGSAGFNALHASLTADETETDTDVAIDDIEELIMTKYA